MSTHAKNGREWARMSNLKAGQILHCDGDFTCGIAGKDVVVGQTIDGKWFVNCNDGRHFLDGQLATETGGSTDHLVGMWPV